MDNFLEKIKKVKEGVVLDARKKSEMRHFLAQEMYAKKNSIYSTWQSFILKPVPVSVLALLLLIFGVGTTAAAQNSLPGDPLYSLKLLSEEVRVQLAQNNSEKAEIESKRIERRLEEAAKLASVNKLDAAAQEELETNLEKHLNRVNTEISILKAENKNEVAMNLESGLEASFNAHQQVFAKLQNDQSGEQDEIAALQNKIESKLNGFKIARQESEEKIIKENEGKKSGELAVSKIAAATNLIRETREYVARENLDSVSGGAAASRIAPSENSPSPMGMSLKAAPVVAPEETKLTPIEKLQEAEKLLKQAEEKLKEKNFGNAFELANKAVRLAEEAKVALRVEAQLKIKVELKPDENLGGEGSLKEGESEEGR